MFSGQGSQYFQMGRELYLKDRCFQGWMDKQDTIVRDILSISITELLYTENKISDLFNQTLHTHPAIFMVQYALAQVLREYHMEPDYVLGNSLGEFVAAAIVGIMSYEDALRSVIEQAQVLEANCDHGGMIAVLDSPEIFSDRPQLHRASVVAAVNYDNHFVVSGARDSIAEVEEYLKMESILHQALPVSIGFHSPAIDPAKEQYLSILSGKHYGRPTLPFVSGTSASLVKQIDKHYLWNVIRQPIAFKNTVSLLENQGNFVYVDLGPSGTLAGFVRKNLKDDSHSKSFPILTLFGRDLHNLGIARDYVQKNVVKMNSKVKPNDDLNNYVGRDSKENHGKREKILKVYIFPGQGSQTKGMGSQLFDQYDDLVSKADRILGYSIKELCLFDPNERINKTQYTQPALYVVNALSYMKKIEDTGIEPDYLVGHSLGEYNALLAGGAFDFETGLRLVKKRGQLMSLVDGGGMAAVIGADKQTIEANLSRNNLTGIDIANYNSASQIVISGLAQDIDRAGEVFRNANIMFIPLNVSAAFHSRYMESVKNEFEEFLGAIDFSILRIPVIANVTTRPYQYADIARNMVNQITGSVRWTESVHYLLGLGEIEFQEIGPGNVLTRLVAKIKQEIKPAVLNTSGT